MSRTSFLWVLFLTIIAPAFGTSYQSTLSRQLDAAVKLYEPEQHELYDGHFIISASRIYQVGVFQTRLVGITWATIL